jgi:hypothetical protein
MTKDEIRKLAAESKYSQLDIETYCGGLSLPMARMAVNLAASGGVDLYTTATHIKLSAAKQEAAQRASDATVDYSDMREWAVLQGEIITEIKSGDHRPYPKDMLRRAALVAEEAGELIKATVDLTRDVPGTVPGEGLRGRVYNEAKQTAAMAIKLMAAMRADQREDEQ